MSLDINIAHLHWDQIFCLLLAFVCIFNKTFLCGYLVASKPCQILIHCYSRLHDPRAAAIKMLMFVAFLKGNASA